MTWEARISASHLPSSHIAQELIGLPSIKETLEQLRHMELMDALNSVCLCLQGIEEALVALHRQASDVDKTTVYRSGK